MDLLLRLGAGSQEVQPWFPSTRTMATPPSRLHRFLSAEEHPLLLWHWQGQVGAGGGLCMRCVQRQFRSRRIGAVSGFNVVHDIQNTVLPPKSMLFPGRRAVRCMESQRQPLITWNPERFLVQLPDVFLSMSLKSLVHNFNDLNTVTRLAHICRSLVLKNALK
eukprot:s526_g16.t1